MAIIFQQAKDKEKKFKKMNFFFANKKIVVNLHSIN